MLFMNADYYNDYTRRYEEPKWEKQERLDYCDRPLVKHGNRIRQELSSLMSLLTGRSIIEFLNSLSSSKHEAA